ncbi:hypothetical protein ACFS5L_41090 [Streptomyces phyllanthi]
MPATDRLLAHPAVDASRRRSG